MSHILDNEKKKCLLKWEEENPDQIKGEWDQTVVETKAIIFARNQKIIDEEVNVHEFLAFKILVQGLVQRKSQAIPIKVSESIQRDQRLIQLLRTKKKTKNKSKAIEICQLSQRNGIIPLATKTRKTHLITLINKERMNDLQGRKSWANTIRMDLLNRIRFQFKIASLMKNNKMW